MRDRLWIPATALVVLLGAIYAVETRKEIRTLQREDELAQQTLDRLFGTVTRLEARLFGPVADEPIGDLPAGEQVEIPATETKWHSVFVWPPDRIRDRRAAQMALLFRESPALQSLLAQTIVHEQVAGDDNPAWKSKYSGYFGGEAPQFWLLQPNPQDPSNSTTIYKISSSELPKTGDQMARDIRKMISERCIRKPKPVPPVAPPRVNVEVTIPDLTPDRPEPEPTGTLWWLVPIGIAGLGVGVLLAWAKSKTI